MAAAAPSSLASSVEKTNGAKLSRLLIDGGTTVLRKVFDGYHPPANLAADFNACYTILNNLLRCRILKSHQWDKLFPPCGASPDSSTFDITLLFILLTNICGLSPPPSGWHAKPSPSDTSLEANLARIKFFRNVLYGHVTTTGVDTPSFTALWLEISAVLVALGFDQAEIDRLKEEHCGEEEYLELLSKWADSEEDIKTKLKNMHQTQTTTQQTVEEVRHTQMEDHKALQDSQGEYLLKYTLSEMDVLYLVKSLIHCRSECKKGDMEKSTKSANNYQHLADGLVVLDTKEDIRYRLYFKSISCNAEQEILKPWSNSQVEFIVFTCLSEGDCFNEVNCLFALSALAFKKGDATHLEEIQRIAVQYQHYPNAGSLMNNLGVMFTENVMYEKSEKCFTVAKECFEREQDHLREAVATLNLAVLHKVLGEYQNARRCCDAAASLCHDVSMRTLKEVRLPERLLRRVADMLEEFGNSTKFCGILEIGVLYDISGSSYSSTVNLTKWLMKIQLKEQNDEKIDAEELEDFTSCLFSFMGKPAAVLLNAEFMRTVMIAAKINLKSIHPDKAHRLLKRLEAAFLLVCSRNDPLYGSLLYQIGRFKLITEMTGEAESALKQAEDILIHHFGRKHHLVASCKCLLGMCALLKNDTKEALNHLSEALIMFKKINPYHPEVAEILLKFALLDIEEGNSQSVQDTVEEAVDIFMSSCGEFSPKTAGGYLQSAVILQRFEALRWLAVDKAEKATALSYNELGMIQFRTPDVIVSRSLLGVMQLSMGMTDEAEDSFIEVQKHATLWEGPCNIETHILAPEVAKLHFKVKTDRGRALYSCFGAYIVSLTNLVCIKTGKERQKHLDALCACLEQNVTTLEIRDFAGQDLYCVSHKVPLTERPVFLILSWGAKLKLQHFSQELDSDSTHETVESGESSMFLSSSKKSPLILFWRIPHTVQRIKEFTPLASAFRESINTLFLQPKFRKSYEEERDFYVELTVPPDPCNTCTSTLCSHIDCLPLLVEVELSDSHGDFDYLTSWASSATAMPPVHVSYFSYEFSNQREAELVFDHLILSFGQELALNRVQVVEISSSPLLQYMAFFPFQEPSNSSLSVVVDSEFLVVKCRTLKESESTCICSLVGNTLEKSVKSLCELVRVNCEPFALLHCEGIAADDGKDFISPRCSSAGLASETMDPLTFTGGRDQEPDLVQEHSVDNPQNQDAIDGPVSGHRETIHANVDVCLCLLDCLLSDRPALPEEKAQNSRGMEQCSCGCNPPVHHNHSFFSVGSASSLNSLPVSPSTFSESWCPLLPRKASSDSLSSVTKLKGSSPHALVDQIGSEELTYEKHMSENSSAPSVDCKGLHVKMPEKSSQYSDRETDLSSCEEVLTTGESYPDPELKDPNQLNDLCELPAKVSEKELLSDFADKSSVQSFHGSDIESCVVHVREHPRQGNFQSSLNQTHKISTEQLGSITEPSCTAVSEDDAALSSLKDELAATRNQCHILGEKISQLEEKLKQSESEKHHLQTELGRYQFLEDKERRNERLLLSVRAGGSEKSRPCGTSASPVLTSMDGRLLGGAASLQGPSFLMQARLLEISNSLSTEELKQMKFLAKSKVSGFRLARIREGYELFEELETRVEHPHAYIGQLLEGIQRLDLSEKLGLPVHDSVKTGPPNNSAQSFHSKDNSSDVPPGSRDREMQLSDETSHFSTRTEVSGFDQNSFVSVSSSRSSDKTGSDMISMNAENDSLSSQGALYVEEGTQFPSSPGDSILSKSSCSTTVSSSDPLIGSAQTTQVHYSNSNSQDSHDSSVNPRSVAAKTEISSDSSFNPTTSEEEIVGSFQLLNTADDGSEKEDTKVASACASKSEDREKRTVDLCDGAVQSEARASTVGATGGFTDSSACADVTSQYGSNVVPCWQQSSFADNQRSVSSVAAGACIGPTPDWERLGARPKQSQVQRPPGKQVPQEFFVPVADGLAGDFLARHSQDRALHRSLYQDGSDTSLFTDTPAQGASFVDGMVNASETHKAKPYFGECQAASVNDPYGRLGNLLTSVASEGCERSNTAGGFSYNEYFNGSTGHVARHLPIGSNFPVHGNYSSQNPLNAANSYSLQSGFVHNPSRFAGVEPFGREPYVPLDGHLGLYSSVHGSEPFQSGMTGSSFAGSAWMGAVGTQPGHFTHGTQRYTGISDNTSTITPEQDKSQTPQNTSITVGNQFRSTSNDDYVLHVSASTENNAGFDIGNSGLPAPSSVSRSNGSGSGVDSSTTSWPALICGTGNTLTVGSEVAAQGAADGNTDSLLGGHHGDANNNAGGSMLNRDFGTDSVESTDNSLLALEQRVAEACALVERVIREREEREQFGREIERKEQMIREQRARERREREEREMQEAARWPQQQDAITPRSQWLCEHYQRYCRVRFPCCTQFYPCHRCHNNSRACDNEEAKACHATHLKCSHCHHEQEIGEDSAKCRKCGGKMSAYFCSICKHFTSVDKNPYHCDKCGICRIHEDKSFHCEVCNVCLDKRLQGNHKCRPDSGHDECCICLEDAFSGCQILPCSHKVHRECAIAMIQNGIRTCPICRHPLYSPRE